MTTIDTITDDQIRALRHEAEAAGDLEMAMICCRALGDELEDAEDGTAGALARDHYTTETALARVVEVINDAATQAAT